jgi:hypothetical protein
MDLNINFLKVFEVLIAVVTHIACSDATYFILGSFLAYS